MGSMEMVAKRGTLQYLAVVEDYARRWISFDCWII